MTSETWEVILREDYSGGTGISGGASTTMGQNQVKKPPEEQRLFQDAGKVVGALAGVSSILALVIGSIHRSKIFSTFMDSFLTIMSALADLLLLPLVPILAPALMWIWKTLGPLVKEFSQQVMEFIKDPWKGIQNMFAGVGDAIKTITAIFGGGPDSALGVIGSNAATILKKAGDEISEHGKNMWEILTNEAIPWTQKLELIWQELQNMWTDFINDPTVQSAWQTIWSTIESWAKEQLDKVWKYFEDKVTEVWPKVVVFAKQAFSDIMTYVIANAPTWIINALSAIPQIIGDLISKLWNSGGITGKAAVGGIVGTTVGSLLGSPIVGGAVGTAAGATVGWAQETFSEKNQQPQQVDVRIQVDQSGRVSNVDTNNGSLEGWKSSAQYGATW